MQDKILGGILWCKEGGAMRLGGAERLIQWQMLTFAQNRKKLNLILNL